MNEVQAVPRFHRIVVLRVAGRPMRVVLTPDGPLEGLIAYVRRIGAHKSPAWETKVAQAVGLLYDFWTVAKPDPQDGKAKRFFFPSFVEALRDGTVLAAPPWSKPRDLFWPQFTKKRQREIISLVTRFSDWIAAEADFEPLNPTRPVLFHEQVRAYWKVKSLSTTNFLGHLDTDAAHWRRAGRLRREQEGPTPLTSIDSPPMTFPADKFADLLSKGFRRRRGIGDLWETHDIRGMMLAMLGFYGGLRASEAFHLFVQDIEPEFVSSATGRHTLARVRLYHPSDGDTRHRNRLASRSKYLLEQWGRQPRNQMRYHPEYAGWKELLLTNGKHKFTDVMWVGPESVGELFWQLYEMYVAHVRPPQCHHPYLFVVEQGATRGRPYPLTNWHECFATAVKRIGETPRKDRGTTSHGLRHAVGQRLKKMAWQSETERIKVTQHVLHHRSAASQAVYTKTSRAEAHEILMNALSSQSESDALAMPTVRILIGGTR